MRLQHGIDSLKSPQINYAYLKLMAFMDGGDVIIRRLSMMFARPLIMIAITGPNYSMIQNNTEQEAHQSLSKDNNFITKKISLI